MENSTEDLLEDEWYQVRYSGELPEIAFHSSLFFLTCDHNGPKIVLDEQQISYLQQAAVDRFREIVLRDILPENRGKSIYRGVGRTIANWRRYQIFCKRQNLDVDSFKSELAQQLKVFLLAEQDAVDGCADKSGLNCCFDELVAFAEDIGMADRELVTSLCHHCCIAKEAG